MLLYKNSIVIFLVLQTVPADHPLFSLHSFLLEVPVLSSWIHLLLQPLLGHVGISPQPPIIVIASHESVHVVRNKEEYDVHKRSVCKIGGPDTHQLETVEGFVETLAPRLADQRFCLFNRLLMDRSSHAFDLRWYLRLTLTLRRLLIVIGHSVVYGLN